MRLFDFVLWQTDAREGSENNGWVTETVLCVCKKEEEKKSLISRRDRETEGFSFERNDEFFLVKEKH